MAHIARRACSPSFPVAFTAREYSTINRAMRLIERHRLRDAPILTEFADFDLYMVMRFAGLTNEQGHVLYLRADGGLLSAEAEVYGNGHSVAWDLRAIVLRAVTLGTDQVIMAHNHPNDNATPSKADLRNFRWAESALKAMQIHLIDSYVVTSRSVTSIRGCRELLAAKRKPRPN